jgi:intracellular sulfur oxidation DsrE/DsrF family protein
MMTPDSVVPRRSFIANLGGPAALFAGGVVARAGSAPEQSSASPSWEPVHHTEDDWLDRVPGKHRMVFDSSMPEGFGYALLYAGNYYTANADGYGLKDSELAVVIIARHFATPFAFNDVMWKKYGSKISEAGNFLDPRTKSAPSSNLYQLANIGLPNKGGTINALIKRGVQFAVCQMATRQLADMLAESFGGNGESIFKELSANLIENSRLVPAGIVAVNRAQERGYTLATT